MALRFGGQNSLDQGTTAITNMTAAQNSVWTIWRNAEGTQISYARFDDTIGWSATKSIPNVATGGNPSITWTGFTDKRNPQGKITLAAWRGSGSDESIWTTYFIPDTKGGTGTWLEQSKIEGIGSSIGPDLAFASISNSVWAVWKGNQGDESLYYSSWAGPGSAWSRQSRISGVGTTQGPSVVYFNDFIWAAWKGTGDDPQIYYAYKYPKGDSPWSAQAQVPKGLTTAVPQLAVVSGRLYLFWKSSDSDTLNYAWWNGNPQMWVYAGNVSNFESSAAPAGAMLAPSQDLILTWKGAGSNDNISWAFADVVASLENDPHVEGDGVE